MQTIKLLQELFIDITINIKEIHYLSLLKYYLIITNNEINELFNLIKEIDLNTVCINKDLYISKDSLNLDLENNFNIDLFKILSIKICKENREISQTELNKIVSDLI